jgi:hypothetical protein
VPVTFPPPSGDGTRGSLTLAPGDHVEANASTPMEKLYPVSGVINGLAGRSASFFVATGDGEPIDAFVVNPDGTFRLRLPSGSYRLTANPALEQSEIATAGAQQLAGRREITVGESALEGISMTLEPPAMLPIEVEYQAVTTGAQNAPPTPPPYLNASLEGEDPGGPERTLPSQPRTLPGRAQALQAGDPMVFRDVEPGRYVLQTRPGAAMVCGVSLVRQPGPDTGYAGDRSRGRYCLHSAHGVPGRFCFTEVVSLSRERRSWQQQPGICNCHPPG